MKLRAIKIIVSLFIFFFLIEKSFADLTHHHHKKAVQEFDIQFKEQKNNLMFIKILDKQTKKPLDKSHFIETHTKKIHLFIISEDLETYIHTHPKEEKEIGIYSFEFKPKKGKNYRVWGDLTSVKTGKQEYTFFDIKTGKSIKPLEYFNTEYQFEDKKAILTFDKPLKSQTSIQATLKIVDSNGKDFTKLEDIMGAKAHLVGFAGKDNIIHIHPMKHKKDLIFHITFPEKGFIKLFAQIQIDGKEYFLPFGINVE